MKMDISSRAVLLVAVAAAAPAGLSYVTLGSFSWDQDNEKIRVRCCEKGIFFFYDSCSLAILMC